MPVANYRERPPVIQALQLTKDTTPEEIKDFLKDITGKKSKIDKKAGKFSYLNSANEDWEDFKLGDYLVLRNNSFFVMTATAFNDRFELV